jgi:hypothetical protein
MVSIEKWIMNRIWRNPKLNYFYKGTDKPRLIKIFMKKRGTCSYSYNIYISGIFLLQNYILAVRYRNMKFVFIEIVDHFCLMLAIEKKPAIIIILIQCLTEKPEKLRLVCWFRVTGMWHIYRTGCVPVYVKSTSTSRLPQNLL